MPHQCTTCDYVFPDGSKRMLAGCPNCGGKKFQFLPPGAQPDQPSDAESPASGDEDAIIEAPTDPDFDERRPPEDLAQASARRTIASSEELPPPPGPSPADTAASEEPTAESEERPDLETLREELNQQFESIKILEPGQYELNLMGLYDREEYIIALEEDGRYVIDVASTGARGSST